jgi:hypothetical protein
LERLREVHQPKVRPESRVQRLRLEAVPTLTIEVADDAALDHLTAWLRSPTVRRELRIIRAHLGVLSADSPA